MIAAKAVCNGPGSFRQTADLLYTWTARHMRARYEQSLLGWLWAVAQPAAQVAIFSLIFTRVIPIDTGGIPYVLFSFVALAPWAFLSAALTDMTSAITDNMALVSKIHFRREVLPISAMRARLIDFFVATAVTIVLVACYRYPFEPSGLLLLPIVLLIHISLIAGIGLACAAANTFLRDVRPLLVLVLQVWFYASPILYPVAQVPANVRGLYALNPAVGIIEGYRAVWLSAELPVQYLYASAAVAGVCLIGGWLLFRQAESLFADVV
jgi:lipopolysaccharide transport system permease protein